MAEQEDGKMAIPPDKYMKTLPLFNNGFVGNPKTTGDKNMRGI